MALVLKDRVRETTATAGTGTVTLAGAVLGFQSFAVIGNGNTTYYAIADPTTGDWEVGLGTYTSSGTTLSRDLVLESSNSGSLVNFAANAKDVFCTYPAERSMYVDGSSIVPGASASLPVVYGGTGQTTYTDGQLLIGNTATSSLSKSTLTAGSNITITNGNGTITIASTNSGGDVVGPASATDNAIARFDGTTGKLIQNSAVTIADDGATVISVDSATDALRITQIGAGNALLVEDSANPDSTPVVVTNAGRFVIGYTTNIAGSGGVNSFYQQHGTSNAGASAGFYDWQNVAIAGPIYNFNKSKSGTIGTRGIVASGDRLGAITFAGDDGTNFISAGQIACLVDGTPGTNDMPGRLTFSTTADGTSTVTERMRIDNAGLTSFGIQANGGPALSTTVPAKLYLSTGTYTDTATAASGTVTHGTIAAFDNPAIAATNLTVTYTNASTLYIDGAPTAGTNVTITNPYALYVAAGTNYFAGNVGIATTTPGSALDVKGTFRLSGSSSGYVGLAPAAAAGSTTYTLPSADGTSGQVLSTNGSGILSWATATGGGGGATGGGTDKIFWENDQTVTTSYSIPSAQNAGTFGPITINSGATVTVPSGVTWTVV